MRPLQFQNVDIPLAVSIDESMDDRVAPIATLLKAENCEFTKLGALKKRHGFTALGKSIEGAGALWGIRALFSTGRELCLADRFNLYAYDEANDTWRSRGGVAPAVGKTRTLHRDMYDHHHCDLDCDEQQNYVLVASHREGYFPAGTSNDLALSVWALPDWTAVHEPYRAPTDLHKPKVAHSQDLLLCIGARTTDGVNLDLYTWNPYSPNTAPVYFAGNPLTNTLYFSANMRTYDICDGPHYANYAYYDAWVRTGQGFIDIEARRGNSAVTTATTLTAAADWQMLTVAIHYDATHDCLWVLWVESSTAPATAGRCRIWLTRFTWGLGNVWSRLLWTGIGGGEVPAEHIHTLGVVVDDVPSDRAVCVWTAHYYDDSIAPPERFERTYSLAVDTDNANMSALNIIHNESMLTKPWTYGDRVYVTLTSDFARSYYGKIWGYPWATNTQYELALLGDAEGAGAGERYLPAGVHDVGTASAPNVENAVGNVAQYGEGAAQNVAILSVYRRAYANHSRSTSAYLGQTTWSGEGRPVAHNMRACDSVELDYLVQPQAARSQEGQLFISGAHGSWYEGIDCRECHIPTPPVFVGTPAVATGQGSLPGGTYYYIPVWIGRDDSGSLHRGPIGPYSKVVIAAELLDNKVTLHVRTVGFTSRWEAYGELIVALYRSDKANGFYQRCNSMAMVYNQGQGPGAVGPWPSADYISVVDPGDSLGEPLYTNGGAYENVCPEGFAWCATHNERVWTGGHFRRARVQFSQRYTPGTATELNFPPEFHEANGFVLPNGEDCMGLAPLDDKLIIFSDCAIYAIAGTGPNNDGTGSDFSQLTLVTDLIGCDDGHSVVSVPGEGVMFLGDGTIQLLTRSLEIEPIGQAVRDQLAAFPTIVSADCLPERYQVLFVGKTTAYGDCLIFAFDYRQRAWTTWRPRDSISNYLYIQGACVHRGEYYIAEGDEIYKYDTSTYYDDTTRFIERTVETSWIQVGGPNGWQRVRDAMLLAEYRDAHKSRLYVFSDFSDVNSQAYRWDDAELVAMYEHASAKREQLKLRVLQQKCQAIKLRYVDYDDSSTTGESSVLFSFGLRVGVKPGLTKVSADQLA